MNFTSSPYERTMEEVHHDEKHIPQKASKDRLVRIIRIGRVLSKFSAARSTSKSRDKRLVFGPHRSPAQRVWWERRHSWSK